MKRVAAAAALMVLVLAPPGPSTAGDGSKSDSTSAIPSSATSGIASTYKMSWTNGSRGWITYEQGDEPYPDAIRWRPSGGSDGGAYVSSVGPWWLDGNHAQVEGGAGYLHLIQWNQSWRMLRHQGVQRVTYRDDTGFPETKAIDKPDLDFRGARVTVWVRGRNLSLPSGGEFLFWIAAWSETIDKYVYYAFTAKPLTTRLQSGRWERLSFVLPTEEDRWTCLGGSGHNGCSNLTEVLSDVNQNYGFNIFGVDPYGQAATGTIQFDGFRLRYVRRH